MSVLIDFEGFMLRSHTYVIKELAAHSFDGDIFFGHWTFKPPLPFEKLSKEDQKQCLWITKNLHGISWEEENFTGNRLLDLASGPTVHNLGTAASYFSNIVLTDLLESNLVELRKWLNKEPGCIDWTVFIKIVAKAENRTDVEEACKEIEERIRSSVKDVIHCDLLNDEVISKEHCEQPFDVIISALTLENVAANWDSYSKCLSRMNRLLKKGGKLVMIGLTLGIGYECNEHLFHYLKITQDEIHRAIEVNGFGDIKWKVLEQKKDTIPYLCEKAYFVTSTKL